MEIEKLGDYLQVGQRCCKQIPLLLLIVKIPFLIYNVQLPIKEKKEAVEQWFLLQFCDISQVTIIHKYI